MSIEEALCATTATPTFQTDSFHGTTARYNKAATKQSTQKNYKTRI